MAFLEAMLVVPLWVLLFAGFVSVSKLSLLRLTLGAEARNCAHRVALNGCAKPVEGCLEQTLQKSDTSTEKLRDSAHAARRSTRVSGPTDEALDRAFDALVGGQIGFVASEDLATPSLLGGGKRSVQSQVQLPCLQAPLPPPENGRSTLELLRGL